MIKWILWVALAGGSEVLWAQLESVSLETVYHLSEVQSDGGEITYLSGLSKGAVDAEGNLYLINAGDTNILKLSPEGKLLQTIGCKGDGPGEFRFRPAGYLNTGCLAVGPEGKLYVLENMNMRVQVFDSEGDFDFSFRINRLVNDMAFDSKGNLYMMTLDNGLGNHILVYNKTGAYIAKFGSSLFNTGQAGTEIADLGYIAISKDDEIFTLASGWPYISKYNSELQHCWTRLIPGGAKQLDALRTDLVKFKPGQFLSITPDYKVKWLFFSLNILGDRLCMAYGNRNCLLIDMQLINSREYQHREVEAEPLISMQLDENGCYFISLNSIVKGAAPVF